MGRSNSAVPAGPKAARLAQRYQSLSTRRRCRPYTGGCELRTRELPDSHVKNHTS